VLLRQEQKQEQQEQKQEQTKNLRNEPIVDRPDSTQVFVTAVPVLVMVKDDYYSFTILKSLVICVGDQTTLAMVFVPKMLLVSKYGDFDARAVSALSRRRCRTRPRRTPSTSSCASKTRAVLSRATKIPRH